MVVEDDSPPPRKKQRRCSVLDLCGSQLQTYQEELPTERQIYNMYVDGSHRPKWPSATSMSAGGFSRGPVASPLPGGYPGARAPCSWGNFSLLLVGGAIGSLPSELGAIWVGCARVQRAIDMGSIDSSSSEVHMHTDCQGAANMLKRKGARVPPKLLPLVTGEGPDGGGGGYGGEGGGEEQ